MTGEKGNNVRVTHLESFAVPKIQRLHRSCPIKGVIELVVTLQFKNRVRALVARFEGVDGRWLCTEFKLL